MNRVKHFPGLDSLRFFAALSVLIAHVELVKSNFYLNNKMELFTKFNFGGMGVYFFFVLSGFLITYLLLSEKEKYTTISLKKFYVRRILRIWPLYYLILILGFFILPHFHSIDYGYFKKYFEINYTSNLILYLFILPQLAFAMLPAVPHIGQSWSIGVEELFYAFWPLFVKYSKNVLHVIVKIIIVYVLFKTILLFAFIKYPHTDWIIYMKNFFVMCRFESMLIGAWGAYIYFHAQSKILKIIYNQFLFAVTLLLIPIINWFLYDGFLQNGIHILLSVCFLIIILNVATNEKSFLKLNYPWLNYLGKISYGIYMYHLMVIPFVIIFFVKVFSFDGTSFCINCWIYVLSTVISILLSSLSYHLFESYFLKFKTRFEVK